MDLLAKRPRKHSKAPFQSGLASLGMSLNLPSDRQLTDENDDHNEVHVVKCFGNIILTNLRCYVNLDS